MKYTADRPADPFKEVRQQQRCLPA